MTKSLIPKDLDLGKRYAPSKTEKEKEETRERHRDPKWKKEWLKRTEEAANHPVRLQKISEYNLKHSKFKEAEYRQKAYDAKVATGSIIDPEKARQIYYDPDFWKNDRLYGASVVIAKKYKIEKVLARELRDNSRGYIPQVEHDQLVSEWQNGPAEKWIIYTPGIEWLSDYDRYNESLSDSQRSTIPPSAVFEARFNSTDPVTYLMDNYPTALNASTPKGKKDAYSRKSKSFEFLTINNSKKYVFYTRSEAADWCIKNFNLGESFQMGIGNQFGTTTQNKVVWKIPTMRGFIFRRENPNEKGQKRHNKEIK